jgi:uncharacterized protein with HEPN domain
MSRDFRVFLQDIWESILFIEEYTKGFTEKKYCDNQQLQDAVNRRFEIIGEAVKSIDDFFKAQHPAIPWHLMAGMRDVLIHEYFGVNPHRVWETIKKDLPELKNMLQAIIKEEG